MWVWCMSDGVCLCLGFLGIPWDSITQIFPILVPRLFWYQIMLYDTVFEAFSRLQIFPIPPKKWKFPVPVCHTVARAELDDPSVEDILKDWAACAERMKPQPRLSVIRANVNLKLEENLVRNHRNAMTPQDSLGISKIKLYLHDGPVYRWYNWYKNQHQHQHQSASMRINQNQSALLGHYGYTRAPLELTACLTDIVSFCHNWSEQCLLWLLISSWSNAMRSFSSGSVHSPSNSMMMHGPIFSQFPWRLWLRFGRDQAEVLPEVWPRWVGRRMKYASSFPSQPPPVFRPARSC